MKSKKNQQSKAQSARKTTFTINNLSRLLGKDRRTIERTVDGVVPTFRGKQKLYRLEDVEAALRAKPKQTLREEKLREEIRKLRIANDQAEGKIAPELLVNRLDVENALGLLGWALRIGSEGLLPQLAVALAAEPDLVRSRIIIRQANYSVAINAFACEAAYRIPRWMVDALTKDIVSCVTVTREELDRMGEFLLGGAQFAAQKAIESEPKGPKL